MNIDALRQEFDALLEEKNYNYTDPNVIKKGLEFEKKMYAELKRTGE